MRVWSICAAALLSILVAFQDSQATDVYGFGTYWELKDSSSSWGGGLGLALPLMGERLKLDGRVFFFDNSSIDSIASVDLIPIDIGLQFFFNPREQLSFYGMGGFSYIYADGKRIDVDSDFGAYLGVGTQYEWLQDLPLFAELNYRVAELDTDSRNVGDLDVSGWNLNFGLKFKL